MVENVNFINIKLITTLLAIFLSLNISANGETISTPFGDHANNIQDMTFEYYGMNGDSDSLWIDHHELHRNFLSYSTILQPTDYNLEAQVFRGFVEEEINKTSFDPILLEDAGNKILEKDHSLQQKKLNKAEPLSLTDIPESSSYTNRLKTIYFLTALETLLVQNTQIEDAFVPGADLTGGGNTKNRFYGYQNILENVSNPINRAVKGAEVDNSGFIPNLVFHPAAGFTTMSYMLASGASTKEAFAVSLANNVIFEYVVEGTYVAPSGIDLLTTASGSVLAYLSYKYLMPTKLSKVYIKLKDLTERFSITFEPTIAPTRGKDGAAIGVKVVFKR